MCKAAGYALSEHGILSMTDHILGYSKAFIIQKLLSKVCSLTMMKLN
jgi:hypothetical protein